VAEAILRAAGEDDVMSVVVGSRGRSGFRSALLGSVSNGVVQHCAKPVVVVHTDPAAKPK
jgi:nucleotide-binding universal stress UspA family protein